MIVLDTNVVSELLRARPEPAVIAWVDGQDVDAVALAAITVAELRLGAALLPGGRRRTSIGNAVEQVVAEFAPRRVLPFDLEATERYAAIISARTKAGRPVDALDAQIAAICLRHGASLATRTVKDFQGIDLDVVNPWAA